MFTPSSIDIDQVLAGMAADLRKEFAHRQISAPLMVGIYTGGAWIAERLHEALGLEEPMGTLDISFYRDDFTRVGINPQVKPSHLPVNIDERHIVLVDDVLNTGRTIRAALNEIFDYGRPASIMLAVLVERGGRELPIQADVVGLHAELTRAQHLKLHGPSPLGLELVEPPQKA